MDSKKRVIALKTCKTMLIPHILPKFETALHLNKGIIQCLINACGQDSYQLSEALTSLSVPSIRQSIPAAFFLLTYLDRWRCILAILAKCSLYPILFTLALKVHAIVIAGVTIYILLVKDQRLLRWELLSEHISFSCLLENPKSKI